MTPIVARALVASLVKRIESALAEMGQRSRIASEDDLEAVSVLSALAGTHGQQAEPVDQAAPLEQPIEVDVQRDSRPAVPTLLPTVTVGSRRPLDLVSLGKPITPRVNLCI